MSNYVNNLNELINTKKELKDIIIESTGENPSEVFSYYPSYIRSAIASGSASEEAVNSYISAYLSAYNYIDQDTLSSNSYITESDVAQMGYITMGDVSACGYLTQHQDLSSYATKSYVVDYVATYAPTPDLSSYITSDELAQELSSYVTKTELSAQSYATTTDLDNYLPYLGTLQTHYTNSEHFIPKANNTYYLGNNNFKWQLVYTYNIYTNTAYLQDTSYSSSIVPKETGTYTLGTLNKMYAATYTAKIAASNNGLWIDNDGAHKYYAGGSSFRPYTNNGFTLGTDTIRWGSTYSYNYYTGFNTALTSNSDYNLQFSINGATRFGMDTVNFFPNGNGNKNLGTSANQWAYTYTYNLILNGTNIMDIIGDVETLLANI